MIASLKISHTDSASNFDSQIDQEAEINEIYSDLQGSPESLALIALPKKLKRRLRKI